MGCLWEIGACRVAAVVLVFVGAGAALAAAPPKPAEPALLSVPPPATPAPLHSADADAATYQRCMTLARDDPAAARTLAQHWHDRGGAHPAEHCFAVALIGLKQYTEAASRLDKLAQAMVRAPAALRAEVLDQGAQAWLLAGDPARAYDADSAALSLRPNDPDLLVDRAEAAGSAGWFAKAVADLDPVLKAHPSRLDALIYRASAYRAQGHLAPALADIDAALKQAPDSVAALLERGNIQRLRGNADSARSDWDRVAALAPGSAAATAAKANIERLAIPEHAPSQPKPKAAR